MPLSVRAMPTSVVFVLAASSSFVGQEVGALASVARTPQPTSAAAGRRTNLVYGSVLGGRSLLPVGGGKMQLRETRSSCIW